MSDYICENCMAVDPKDGAFNGCLACQSLVRSEIGATQDQRAADASVPYTEGRPLVTTPAHPAAHPLPTPRTDAAIGKFTRRTYTEACICVDAEDMRTIEREAAELRAQLAEQNERHEFELATAHKAALTALQSREEVVRECAATAEQCFDYGPDTKDPQRAYFLGRADAGRAIRKLLEPK